MTHSLPAETEQPLASKDRLMRPRANLDITRQSMYAPLSALAVRSGAEQPDAGANARYSLSS